MMASALGLQRQKTVPTTNVSKPSVSDRGSVSSVDAIVAAPAPDINAIASDAFNKTAAYLKGELEASNDEYRVLEQVNKVTAQKYCDMQQVSNNITKSLKDLNAKYSNIRPYLDQIEEIDASSLRLEEAAYALDAYVKNLEQKFKQLEKRQNS